MYEYSKCARLKNYENGMSHNNNKNPLIKEFIDLEEFGEELFAITPPAPKLSRQQKKHMLNEITGTGFNFTKLGFGFAAMAMTAFAVVFGLAQFSSPTSPLYSLKVGGQANHPTPTLQETANVKAEVTQKQVKVEELKKTGAPQKEITKAEKDLDKTVEVGKKKGLTITKTVDASGNIVIEVRQPSTGERKHESEDEHEDEDHEDSKTSGSESNSGSGSSGSSKTSGDSSTSQPR